MADWKRICDGLCKKLKSILDDVGVKESDWDDFFGEYGDQIGNFVAEKAREFQESRGG